MGVNFLGPHGEKWTHKQFMDYCFQFTNPIFDQVCEDLGACLNCWCSDCGCCTGCGQVDADLFGAHGYLACV